MAQTRLRGRGGVIQPIGQPEGHHLAELNWGVLRYDWEDARVAPFRDALARVFALAERSPGYVWHLPEDAMEREQCDLAGAFGGNPRVASTLSVWRDGESLARFVFRTVHARFMGRARDWFEPGDRGHLVMWWVPEGTRPTVAEGLARAELMRRRGDTAEAFGWAAFGQDFARGYRIAAG